MHRFYTCLLLIFSNTLLFSQDGISFDFNNGSVDGWSSGSSLLSETNVGSAIKIESNGAGPNFETVVFSFPSSLDLSDSPRLSLKVLSNQLLDLRIDLLDRTGRVTNSDPVSNSIRTLNDWSTLTYDFTDRLSQSVPSSQTVDARQITGIVVYPNPNGDPFNGVFFMDDIALGSNAVLSIGSGIPGIKLNQLGFYPDAKKVAVVSSSNQTTFKLEDLSGSEVYSGTLGSQKYWGNAEDSTRIADFTDFNQVGSYRLVVSGIPSSYVFDIKPRVHHELSKAALKYYYYNRASTNVTAEHGGKWARAAGHPDDRVLVHSSAASAERPTGTVISAPKGWYDAGDHNKYIVNSGISTYTLLSLYEHFPMIYDTLELNIPESGNDVPDLLDEIKWNLDWMLAMQDPNDGGVYNKLTSAQFTPNIMPANDNTERYVVGKSTTSALNFAAVMAVAYRVYVAFEDQFPGYADQCLSSAQKAYEWAQENDNVQFVNPPGIGTGEYGDTRLGDEFSWAAAELYIASGIDSYYSSIVFPSFKDIPSWQSVGMLGFMSLSHYQDYLTPIADKVEIRNAISSAVNNYKTNYVNTAYQIPFAMADRDDWEFVWGSNSRVANISYFMLQDYYNKNDQRNFDGALSNLDYLLGRNPLEQSYVSGFGDQPVMHPHQRISQADGIIDPVPGMLAGGPNRTPAEPNCEYPFDAPALSYIDSDCSYSTNEVAINWNAPLSFITGAIEAEELGIKPMAKEFPKSVPVGVFSKKATFSIALYPIPASDLMKVEIPVGHQLVSMELLDLMGNSLSLSTGSSMNVSLIQTGVYLMQVVTDKGAVSEKIKIER